jgi:hypothetical protein
MLHATRGSLMLTRRCISPSARSASQTAPMPPLLILGDQPVVRDLTSAPVTGDVDGSVRSCASRSGSALRNRPTRCPFGFEARSSAMQRSRQWWIVSS